jgi:hypothetical protein
MPLGDTIGRYCDNQRNVQPKYIPCPNEYFLNVTLSGVYVVTNCRGWFAESFIVFADVLKVFSASTHPSTQQRPYAS